MSCGSLLLVVALALMSLSVQANSQSQRNRRWDRVWKKRRKKCASGAASDEDAVGENCAKLHPDENDNCVNRCTSPACYAEVYAANPLEPGEIDMPRWRAFERCARKEAREAKRRLWEAQRQEV